MSTTILRIFGAIWYICLFIVVIPVSMIMVCTTLDQELANRFNIALHWSWPLIIFGIIFTLLAVLIVVWSSLTLYSRGKAYPWSIGSHVAFNPQDLVTTGPYAVVRHPMTTAYLLFLLGIAVTIPSIVMIFWLIPLTAGLFYEYLEYTEDIRLKQWFGQKYVDYQEVTPSIIPHLPFISRPAPVKPSRKKTKSTYTIKKAANG